MTLDFRIPEWSRVRRRLVGRVARSETMRHATARLQADEYQDAMDAQFIGKTLVAAFANYSFDMPSAAATLVPIGIDVSPPDKDPSWSVREMLI